MPSELSTGMKRSVAIARALAVEPQAILYDEPTTMVDPLMSQTINSLIRKMQSQLGMTQIVVTHDIANCAEKVADHVALLDKGRFVFNGTMAELYASDHPVVKEFVEEDRIRFEKEKEFVAKRVSGIDLRSGRNAGGFQKRPYQLRNHVRTTFRLPELTEYEIAGFIGDGAQMMIQRALGADAPESDVHLDCSCFCPITETTCWIRASFILEFLKR